MKRAFPLLFSSVMLIILSAGAFKPAAGQTTDGRLSFALDAGVATPVARDLAWDSRSNGAAFEAMLGYRLTDRIELRAGLTLTKSAFDRSFYEQSVWFPFESPTNLHAQPTNIYTVQSGAAYRILQGGLLSLYVVGEAGYGAVQMPPIEHEFGSDTVSMLRDTRHGMMLGVGAGTSVALARGAALRLEVTSRSLLVPNTRIGDYTDTAKNRLDQLVFRIGVVRALPY